jgi:hypothetical protein
VHEPIDTAGLAASDARRLAERVRDVVARAVPGNSSAVSAKIVVETAVER